MSDQGGETTTPVTIIAPAKASLRKINRKVGMQYRQWLDTQKLRKWCLKIQGDNIQWIREGIQVLQTTRSRRSRNRMLGEETE